METGRRLATARRATTEKAREWSDGRDGGLQGLQLPNGLKPFVWENDGRHDRLGGHETAGKARIFAIGRRGMPLGGAESSQASAESP